MPLRLYGFQKDGCKWMIRRELAADDADDEAAGGILADEMGLGKTFQILKMIRCRSRVYGIQGATLIVAPLSLIEQWKRAAKRLSFKVFVVQSNSTTRPPNFEFDIVLCSYDRLDCETTTSGKWIMTRKWTRVVFDEAHRLRNLTTITYFARMLDATYRWCVTGTPIVKRLRDFAVLLWLIRVPNVEPSIRLGERVQELRDTYMLRRTTKDDEVAEDIDLHYDLHIDTQQFTFSYDHEIETYDLYAAGANSSGHMIEIVQRLRQTCVLADPDLPSTKIERLVDSIREQRESSNNYKAIVFCTWYKEAAAVKCKLSTLGLTGVSFFGNMNRTRRVEALLRFEHEQNIVLVAQIDCGGVGLNLQHATHVYILTPHWNAADELQAVARAYRTGVRHDVVATRFVVEHTIDEWVLKTQARKLQCAAEALDDERIIDATQCPMTFRELKTCLEAWHTYRNTHRQCNVSR